MTPLSRVYLAGKLCRRGARIIVAVGLVVIIILAVNFYNAITNDLNPGIHLNELFITFAAALLVAMPVFFFYLILSALGALLEYMSIEKKPQEEVNDERVEITSLPEMG